MTLSTELTHYKVIKRSQVGNRKKTLRNYHILIASKIYKKHKFRGSRLRHEQFLQITTHIPRYNLQTVMSQFKHLPLSKDAPLLNASAFLSKKHKT